MKNCYWKAPVLGACVFLSEASGHTMYGDVQIHDAVIQKELKIIGRGNIVRSVFEASLRVFGILTAEDSQFNKDLFVTGSDLVLKANHILGDVHITNYLSKPKVVLRGTTIGGKIVFHSMKEGVVDADGASKIEQGLENGRYV